MQLTYDKFNQFQRQSHSEREIVKVEELNQQISRLQLLKIQNNQSLLPSDRRDIDKYIRIYRLALKQIQRMKMQFTKPSLVKLKLTQIFDNQKQEMTLEAVIQKSSQIRSSQIQIPSFKKPTARQNVIDVNDRTELASPALRHFFQKKQAEIQTKSKSNFKSVLQNQQNKSFSRSISRDQPSRSSASSFMKKPTQQKQLKKILQQNKKIKEEYDKKLKRQLELSEFEKSLLKEEKNRYMLKIEQLEGELENLYRANYKLKEEVEVKQKTLKERSEFDSSSSFRNIDENIQTPTVHAKDYYQPYVMRTKHNDLKKLNMKCHSQHQSQSQYQARPFNQELSIINRNDHNFFNTYNNNTIMPQNSNKPQPVIDILGNQLEKQLEQMEKEKSRSNTSQRSSKKWSRQYNPNKHHQNDIQNADDLFRVLREDDEEDGRLNSNNNNKQPNNNNVNYNNSKQAFSVSSKNPFLKKHQDSIVRQDNNHPQQPKINILSPTFKATMPQQQPIFKSTTSLQQRSPQQQLYQPSANYSFTNASNKDYSMSSNAQNYDTFQMTKTYLNLSQSQQSQTNKYIDSRTSTRNKVAFFKDSLILIKNQTFELAFKKSALVNTKDRVRIIFFVKNKTPQAITINLRYQYDPTYFKLKVNEKLQTVLPHSQSREDLEIYAFSTIDLNQVIDIMVDVNFDKYGLWMPILWIQLQETDYFKLPENNQEILIIPDRQFKSFQTAQTIMPLIFGGKDSYSQWAYLYGTSKFGPCFVKLTWEGSELKIQTNAKCIDLLAFVMHHVK